MFRVPPVTGVAAVPPDPDADPPPLLHAASATLATAARDTAASRLLAIGPPPGLDSAEVRTPGRGRNRDHATVNELSPRVRGDMTVS
jgi:hypothetical protein